MNAMPGGGEIDNAPRPSIAERAARRDQVEAVPGDRYRNLLRALRASGGGVTSERDTYEQQGWHPVLWKLLALVAAVLVLYGVARFGGDFWRQHRVDTWSGPNASVQSGQTLDTCPAVVDVHDDVFPNWVRVGSTVYVISDAIRPVPDPAVGKTTYTEAGFSMGSLRLLYDEDTPAGKSRGYVLVYAPPASAARVYDVAQGCQ